MPDTPGFPDSSDFEGGLFPIKDFDLSCAQMMVGNRATQDVRFRARYDRHTTLYLYDDSPIEPFKLLGSDAHAMITGPHFPEPVTLLSVSIQDDVTVYLPSRQPLLWRRDDCAQTVSAVLVNGPSLEFASGRLTFSVEDFEIDCREFKSAREFRREDRFHKDDCIATASVTMARKDGGPISSDQAFTAMCDLAQFLSFLRGGNCTIGNIRGANADHQLAFAHLGFGKVDGFRVERNWCEEQVVRDAPAIYSLFLAAMSDAENARVLRRAIDYYRTANVSRAFSPEMALVASYAALETLVPHILSGRAGWSNNLLGGQTAFADKLRAATAFVGLTTQPLEHAPDLTKRAKADANGDAFEILALFRNRITHHRKAFEYSGREIMEAWQMSQWLCELLLLYLIEHRGNMNDRRRYSGWRGPPVPVPMS